MRCLAVIAVGIILTSCAHSETEEAELFGVDKALADNAFSRLAKLEGQNEQAVRSRRIAVVVDIGKEKCAILRGNKASNAEDYALCIDSETGMKTREFDGREQIMR